MKGNVMDMAVGVIIVGALGKIVTSAVENVIMPVVGKFSGCANFSTLVYELDRIRKGFWETSVF
jgi:large conductance mechanosensitive channel